MVRRGTGISLRGGEVRKMQNIKGSGCKGLMVHKYYGPEGYLPQLKGIGRRKLRVRRFRGVQKHMVDQYLIYALHLPFGDGIWFNAAAVVGSLQITAQPLQRFTVTFICMCGSPLTAQPYQAKRPLLPFLHSYIHTCMHAYTINGDNNERPGKVVPIYKWRQTQDIESIKTLKTLPP
jgi:hypothetical protein